MKKKKDEGFTRKVIIALILLFVLFLFSSCAAIILQFGDTELRSGNVAVIPLHGVIVTSGNSFSDSISADDMVKLLHKVRDDDSVEAVILEINSPGGSPVASDEIGRAVREVRAQNKTVVSWVREVGASGAYWIASNTEYIVANRMSVTGSIGVAGSYFGFEEFIDEHNISYRQFTSGDRKDLGSPFRAMSKDEQKFLQQKLDDIHWFFIDEVARNRNMTFEEVEVLATGEFFLGFEAEKVGLVDELGGFAEAIAYIEAQGIVVESYTLESQRTFWEQLTSVQVTINTPSPTMGITT